MHLGRHRAGKRARLARSPATAAASGCASARYSRMARLSQITCPPSTSSAGTLPDGEWRRICALRLGRAQLDVDLAERRCRPAAWRATAAGSSSKCSCCRSPADSSWPSPQPPHAPQLSFRPRAADNADRPSRARPPSSLSEIAHGGKRKDEAGAAAGGRAAAGRRQEEIDSRLARAQRRLGRARRRSADAQKAWVEAQGFKGGAKQAPAAAGRRRRARRRRARARRGSAPAIPWTGRSWPSGTCRACCRRACYHLADDGRRCRARGRRLGPRRLPLPPLQVGANGEEVGRSSKVPRGADHARALAIVEAVWLGRDLINTPASDLGPAGAGGRRPPARRAARRQRHEHRRRRSAGQELPDDPRRRPRQRPRARG